MLGVIKPNLRSWVDISETTDFTLQNLPFGIFKKGNTGPRVASAIGDYVIDIAELNGLGFINIERLDSSHLLNLYLNDFIALGKEVTNGVRMRLAEILTEGHKAEAQRNKFLIPIDEAELLMPVKVGNYTDFYSSKEHATNVGSMFRDPENALLPNWLHLPVGYHGRPSSIVVSGTEIVRPKGQTIPANSDQPVYGPCKLLDFELEMGFVIGKETSLGTSISTDKAEDYIFGLILFNDWSARDIQKWEYVPLGPFLAKNFASTVSPWVIPLEALEYFRTPGPVQKPEVLPYLQYNGDKNYDIDLEVSIKLESGEEQVVSRSNFKYMYWNMCQQLAHHTVNGCNVQVGDIYASGTISGTDSSAYGSMLELSWRGTKPIEMPDGSIRKFINNGDTVILRGSATKNGIRVGFGEAAGKIVPAL